MCIVLHNSIETCLFFGWKHDNVFVGIGLDIGVGTDFIIRMEP